MEAKPRVFISYSHKDRSLVEKIVHVIELNNMIPLWDDHLMVGAGFDEEIQDYISQSHIFLPLLTKSSSERGWVHQEIGYAIALHIPVFPLTTEKVLPGGMLQRIQAIKVEDDEQHLMKLLTAEAFRKLIDKIKPVPLFECAHLSDERSIMMTNYSNKVASINKYGLVRQKGGLSSFHIPEVSILKKVWIDRYYPEIRSDFHKKVQRDERIALQQHAEKEGVRLIINVEYAIQKRSRLSARTRINTLIEFLKSPAAHNSVIAIQNNPEKKESLTIVGDWFVAESVSFKEDEGFTNTFFSRNISEILRRINDFESELEDLLKESGWNENESKDKAIEQLAELANRLSE
jgi:hypothetical protein